MGLNAVKVLEISITNASSKEILEYLRKYLNKPQKNTPKTLTIATPNTEQLVYAAHHPWFAKILNQADLTLPDSIGVIWASYFLGKKGPKTRVPGVTFMETLAAGGAKQPVPMALIGGRDGVAVKAFECLQQKYSGVSGWAEEPPGMSIKGQVLSIKGKGDENLDTLYFDHHTSSGTVNEYIQMLARKIIDTGVQIVFIALGPPKQEVFMTALSHQLSTLNSQSKHKGNLRSAIYDLPTILMVVGGSFDEISGRIPRAPGWVSTIGMKWLWRLILEPWRIRRQLALVEFVFLVIKAKLLG